MSAERTGDRISETPAGAANDTRRAPASAGAARGESAAQPPAAAQPGARVAGPNAIVAVKLFAVVKQLVGSASVEVRLSDGATVAELVAALVAEYPQLAPLEQHLRFAVDGEYAQLDTPIRQGAEVACIPPVSGG